MRRAAFWSRSAIPPSLNEVTAPWSGQRTRGAAPPFLLGAQSVAVAGEHGITAVVELMPSARIP